MVIRETFEVSGAAASGSIFRCRRTPGFRSATTSHFLKLQAEKRPANDERYHRLDTDLSIEENLREKHIIEFPTLWLSTQDHCEVFPLLEKVETKYNIEVKLPSFFQEVDDSD